MQRQVGELRPRQRRRVEQRRQHGVRPRQRDARRLEPGDERDRLLGRGKGLAQLRREERHHLDVVRRNAALDAFQPRQRLALARHDRRVQRGAGALEPFHRARRRCRVVGRGPLLVVVGIEGEDQAVECRNARGGGRRGGTRRVRALPLTRAGGGRRGDLGVQVEEDEVIPLLRLPGAGGARRHRRIDRLDPVDRRARLGLAPFRLQLAVEDLELLDRLGLAVLLVEPLRQHEADVVLVGTEVGELLEGAEGLVDVPRLLHAVGVLEEVLLRVALEPLGRRDLAELVVDGGACRRLAQDLVAERDGVVQEAALGVDVDRLLVVGERLGDIPLALQ